MKSTAKLFSVIITILILNQNSFAQKTLAETVNPFIGTGGHGHTFPGATAPFGMVQLSPDTRLEGWDGSSGYHYTDSLIYGFSHTHLSGTGIADYCDVLVMPFSGNVEWEKEKYRSSFKKKNEKAHAGFYSVLLDKDNIKAELTATTRAGFHKYTFDEKTNDGKVLIDLFHRDKVLASSIKIISKNEIVGYRQSKSWADSQKIYFYMKFDLPIEDYEINSNGKLLSKNTKEISGENLKAYFKFNTKSNKILNIRVGLSPVNEINAMKNCEHEIGFKPFEIIKYGTENLWNKELSKIEISGGNADQRSIFYTALYHTMIAPNTFNDIGGSYVSTDLKTHPNPGFTNYTVFSLWDTYRALHPLLNLIDKKRSTDFIKTFLAQYKFGGMLPVWELAGNETFCMIGYHSVPVILDAWQKGIRNFDSNLALESMVSYANSNRFGLDLYRSQGFISNEIEHESVSKTLEYSYDDWCIARFAELLGKDSIAKVFYKRSLNYRNLFDPETRHFRGKIQGIWYSPFDATEVNSFYTEGNAWQYSFAAQHDIDGMINLYGGKEKFGEKLNELFTTNSKMSGREQVDVTGLIGQYAHGNEPSHHLAYLFNYAGQPWRTQELVHQICTDFYKNSPDGLIGNEDCGQMSAWYVLSAMGLYQVTPGSNVWDIGVPMFDDIKINLENGNNISIKTKGRSKFSNYVNSMVINKKSYDKTFITQPMIANGANIEFVLSAVPNKLRGTEAKDIATKTVVGEDRFVPVPYFKMSSNKFQDTLQFSLGNINSRAMNFLTTDTSSNPELFVKVNESIKFTSSMDIQVESTIAGSSSQLVKQSLHKIPNDKTIKVLSKINPLYTAGGESSLIDSILGNANWRTGNWQGYFNEDFAAIVDLKSIRTINFIGIHVMQDVNSWILFPSTLEISISDDGINFSPLQTVQNKISTDNHPAEEQMLGAKVNIKTRYIKLIAKNGGKLPAWHESAGSPSHLFIDEVIAQ